MLQANDEQLRREAAHALGDFQDKRSVGPLMQALKDSSPRVRAEAGAVWDDVVVTSLAHGLGGLECLSGIPGSVGATPVQNVGAYGAEVADTIRRVRLLDRRTGEDRWVSPEALQFGYRTSILKHSQAAVVLEVEFALDPDGRSAPIRYGELAAALDAEPGSGGDPARVGRGAGGSAHGWPPWSCWVAGPFTCPGPDVAFPPGRPRRGRGTEAAR